MKEDYFIFTYKYHIGKENYSVGNVEYFYGKNFNIFSHFSYPMRPPVVRFLTKILHPNVSRHGDVGIDSIHHNWSLALTISKVLISVQSLLTDPYCQVI